MGTFVWLDRFAFLGVLALAFWFFGWCYKSKLENGPKKKKTKEIDYEIFYQGKRIDTGYFELEKGQRFRFGFSDRRGFHNDLSLNKYFEKMEDYEEVDELEEKYAAWFELKWTDKGMIVKPAYEQSDRDYRGMKLIHLKNGECLEDDGEIFNGDITVLAKEKNKNSLMVRVFDYNEV